MPPNSLPDSENDIQTVGQLAYVTGIRINEIKQNSSNYEKKLSKFEETQIELRDKILQHEYIQKELHTKIEAMIFNYEKNQDKIQKLKETDLRLQTQIKTISWVAGIFGSLFMVFFGVYLQKIL
jgi:septal ring factor EnvC (AmiA/AmiB activator)